eukprot:TRINITY_DN6606_c0_g1_i2.p1 TRINITY_DN6606_c0_g1~~TRINITY_DN6606_c0_g1_i2.p1  ORF type:complete len:118 (+),score=33.00 TRINITY_DN6606_c0_g1_i2:502-855(+)
MYRYIYEEDDLIFYVWELQLQESAQRKGLGRHLMILAELSCRKYGFEKVCLTVFKDNVTAVSFYKNKMRYVRDQTDPNDPLAEDEIGYEILCKTWPKVVRAQPENKEEVKNIEEKKD